MHIAVKIEAQNQFGPILTWLASTLASYAKLDVKFTDDQPDLILGCGIGPGLRLSDRFIYLIENEIFDHRDWFKDGPYLTDDSGKIDHLGTCFYMLNYLQEYAEYAGDDLSRFTYADSFQSRFKCEFEDLVRPHFEAILQHLPSPKPLTDRPSRLFVSHDNDVLYGSFLQDGAWAIKSGRFDVLFDLIWRVVTRRPLWLNMDEMMDILDQYGIKSTFFWLVHRGKVTGPRGRKLHNADYNYNNHRLRQLRNRISNRGFGQGLHKAISSESYRVEANQLENYPISNRNHFLRLQVKEHFKQLDDAEIKLDFSMGFADTWGLRNCFAMPVRPFNLDRGKGHTVLAVPLMIMDASNWGYHKLSLPEFESSLLNLLDRHKHNAVISILWHNKYFTPYKYRGYLEVFTSVLKYCLDNNIKGITETELLAQNSANAYEP